MKTLNETLSIISKEDYRKLVEELTRIYAGDTDLLIVSDLLDDYELNIMPELETLKQEIINSVDSIQDNLSEKFLDNLSSMLEKWQELSKPIISVLKTRGSESSNIYNLTGEIFAAIREHAINLNNKYDKPDKSLKLMQILKKYLAGISERFTSIINQDISKLNEIIIAKREAQYIESEVEAARLAAEKRKEDRIKAAKQAAAKIKENKARLEAARQKESEINEARRKANYNKWAKNIEYNTEIGLLFKKKFSVSVDGILWDGNIINLESVTGINWHKYKIVLQTLHGLIEINIGFIQRKKFEVIKNVLWLALYKFIAVKILNQLKNGDILYIGGIKFNDGGIFLKNESYNNKEKFLSWNKPFELNNNDNTFIIETSIIDTIRGFSLIKYSTSASYINDMNTHILEFIIRQFMDARKNNPTINKLSDLLNILS